MSYLRNLCLFVYSGVQHILCCVFVFLCLVDPMLPVSLYCPFLIAPSVFSDVYLILTRTKYNKTKPLILILQQIMLCSNKNDFIKRKLITQSDDIFDQTTRTTSSNSTNKSITILCLFMHHFTKRGGFGPIKHLLLNVEQIKNTFVRIFGSSLSGYRIQNCNNSSRITRNNIQTGKTQ